MGVAYSAAKRLVRTETAYIYEQATKDAYEECGVEWYEFLATLDGRTSEICRELDGKHFKVRDAMPGKNYPPKMCIRDRMRQVDYLEGKGLVHKEMVENRRLGISRCIVRLSPEGTDYLEGNGPDVAGVD